MPFLFDMRCRSICQVCGLSVKPGAYKAANIGRVCGPDSWREIKIANRLMEMFNLAAVVPSIDPIWLNAVIFTASDLVIEHFVELKKPASEE